MIHGLFLVLSMSEDAMSGPRVISAPDTFFAKVVLSAVLLIGVAWLVWAIRREVVDPGPDGVSAQTIATRLFGIVWATWILFRWFIPLKRVILSDTSLHVSNFLREVIVPLRDVESVRSAGRHRDLDYRPIRPQNSVRSPDRVQRDWVEATAAPSDCR